MSLNNSYTKYVVKTNTDYTILVGDDVITFTIASPQTATLPLAGTCSPMTGQNIKEIVNSGNSGDTLTIAVQSGNTLVGIGSLGIGQTAFLQANGSVWTGIGGGGVAGTSGFSGASGKSGFSGVSGFSGTSGFSGVSGFSGTSGVSGASGTSGFSGASGASGTSGFSGVSGFSGASGKSGFSGVSGA